MVLVLFFPTLLDALFSQSLDQITSGKMVLIWGLIVASLIVDYLLIEYLAGKIVPRVTKWVNGLVLLEIAIFVPTLFSFACASQPMIPVIYVWLLSVCMIALLSVPLIILLILGLNSFTKNAFNPHP